MTASSRPDACDEAGLSAGFPDGTLAHLLSAFDLEAPTVHPPFASRHGTVLCRITIEQGRRYVLKWGVTENAQHEVGSYRLLHELGVPTIPIHGLSDKVILMEDLKHSDSWRLARQADVRRPAVDEALALWYRAFHSAGDTLRERGPWPDFLRRESDTLTPESLACAASILGFDDAPAMKLALRSLDTLKAAVEVQATTLNYNDFYWTNFALSRRAALPSTITDESPRVPKLSCLTFT